MVPRLQQQPSHVHPPELPFEPPPPVQAGRSTSAVGTGGSSSADAATFRPGFQPGLLWLQSPALEDLAETLWAWWSRYPARPLEEEVVLVPSNGMAEWFKAESCCLQGIFSGPRVELPARFAWRVYRSILGPAAQGARKLDKNALPWWLLRTSGEWAGLPGVQDQLQKAGLNAPFSVGPAGPDVLHLDLYRWCSHTADLFDQYQLFRPDWLRDWADRQARLRADPRQSTGAIPVPPEHAWQVQLWAWLNREAEPSHHGYPSRAALHQACIQRLRSAPFGGLPQLPVRVVLFGSTSLPPMVMELLDALSRHVSVILAVPNPCQVQWVDLSDAPHEGQPLLAAWGKQARDFITQVERFEERLALLEERPMVRVEREASRSQHTALATLQASIHRNEPLQEVAAQVASEGLLLTDGSIQFVRAHTALREVEILHDHLLHQLTSEDTAHRPQPRDVVVMVPNLKTHAAAIRAVFGAYAEGDPRHIPWGLADQAPSPDQGLHEIAAWLLSLPAQRCSASDLRRLLESSAVGKRWSLDDEDRRQLQAWVEASGVRWGLSGAHRESLGLGSAGEAMTWQFGVDRMLAGYAAGGLSEDTVGNGPGGVKGDALDAGWAPLDSVRGLAARAAGQLAGLLRRLEAWRVWAMQPHAPSEWAAAFRQVWADLVEADDPAQERECEALESALHQWLRNTQEAGFAVPIGYALVHQAVLEQLEQPATQGRFRASGVTFCTLMPLRAVPFRIVCLLGMEDGQYPRPTKSRQGDLMTLPRLARPGDRSRRVDDRQLMLDALLSARQHLYISWVGQQATDNQHRPPSVLVGQLRDALTAVWGADAVKAITTDHPMQPFNRAYFQVGHLPATHAHEWEVEWPDTPMGHPQAARESPPHAQKHGQTHGQTHRQTHGQDHAPVTRLGDAAVATGPDLEDTARILRWLKCPVAAFWQELLGVHWPRTGKPIEDDEVLEWGGMTAWSAWQAVLDDWVGAVHIPSAPPAESVSEQAASAPLLELHRCGLMPLGAPGRLVEQSMTNVLSALRTQLQPFRGDHQAHRVLCAGSRFARGKPFASDPRPWRLDLLVEAWWLQARAAARGEGFVLHLVAPDVVVTAAPPDTAQAQQNLESVMATLATWMAVGEPMPATSRLVAASRLPPSQLPEMMNREAERNAAWRRSFGSADAWAWKEWDKGRPVQQWLAATADLYGPFWHWCERCLKVTPIKPQVSKEQGGTP